MARPTYTPTQEERQRIREFILKNSGYNATGQPISDKRRDEALYPKGFTSFARAARISPRALSNLLNSDGPCTEMIWWRIRGEMDRHTEEYQREMAESLLRMTGSYIAATKVLMEVA